MGKGTTALALASAKRPPLHERVYAHLKSRIANQRLAIGERLPTEHELCAQFGVSRITVRHALDRLQNDGFIRRTPNLGTSVISSTPKAQSGWRVDDLEDIVKFGEHASLRVLTYARRKLSEDDAKIFGAATAYYLDGLRCVRGRPIGYTSILLPAAIGRRLAIGDFRQNTVFTILIGNLGARISAIRQRISAGAATAPIAERLRCDIGAPLLHVERTYLDPGDSVVELARSWYLAANFSIEHRIAIKGR